MSVTGITADLAYVRTAIVNVYLFGTPRTGEDGWVLIDAGMPGYAGSIARAAEDRFGADTRPAAVILTHGHFDHVGSLRALSRRWGVPIYAHRRELPYLTGEAAYPPPDPTVGGGMAAMSPVFPRGPFDFGPLVRALPEDGSVPGMPGWRWISTPGHTPGHVSLFRDSDRSLIAGDAFVTTRQESILAALTQRPEMHGPPAYFTPDWGAAARSVEELADLEPEVAATGHGRPMRGRPMREALRRLAENFDELAVPSRGRYVEHPADTSAALYRPAPERRAGQVAAGVALAVVAGALVMRAGRGFRR
jgi:glyoxylase-like metal-dependent hydrolase (beta-lactamase superfamily II)